MVQAAARDFPVAWRAQGDAERFWAWDAMHCPRPLTPLSIDFTTLLIRKQFEMSGRSLDKWTPPFFPNGFLYSAFDPPDPSKPPEPEHQAVEARLAEQAPRLARLWRHRWQPRIRRLCAAVRDERCHEMELPELRRHVADSIDRGALAFALTLEAAGPMFHGVEQLYKFCEEELGADGISLAGASLQGYANASSASELALFDLAGVAKRSGADRFILTAADESLRQALAEGKLPAEFANAFDQAMDRFGWRVPTWFELCESSWREDPAVSLALVRRYLSGEGQDPRAALVRAAAGRRRALRRLRAAFAGSEKLERFEGLWQTARPFVAVSESRALWQLSLGGFLRVPVLALGRRLAGLGVIASPDDVFYLTLAELASGSTEDWQALIAERRRERERWISTVPPLTLGRVLPPPAPGAAPAAPPALPFGARMVSGFSFERSDDSRVLKGQPASPGAVTGIAKVVETVDQAGKLDPGDILVCRFTTPSWSHVFSIVSGIVADAGGVLSHCAILAREYAIPCVPGVRVGTRRIRDGMRLTVDGTQGIVRIED